MSHRRGEGVKSGSIPPSPMLKFQWSRIYFHTDDSSPFWLSLSYSYTAAVLHCSSLHCCGSNTAAVAHLYKKFTAVLDTKFVVTHRTQHKSTNVRINNNVNNN